MAISESGAVSAQKAKARGQASSSKVGIIVTGMHRSGTSATTRMLNLLGCDIASDLVVADQHNPTGYWEAISIAKLNDEMLSSAGFEWNDLQPLKPSWFESPKFAEFQERAIELLDRQVGSSHLFAVKDPRFCRVLPVWTAAVEALGAKPIIVSPIRSPSHVATSLLKRNGMNRAVAQLVWLRYALDGEHWSRDYSRAFFNFSSLLSDWRSVAERLSKELGVVWPRSSVQSASQIDAFINSEKVETGDRGSELSPLVLSVYQLLSRAEQSGLTSVDLEKLDKAREDFYLACSTFSQPLIENQEHGRWLAARLDQKDAEISELGAKSELLSEQIDQIAAHSIIEIEAVSAASAAELERRIAEIEADAIAAGLVSSMQVGDVETEADPLARLGSVWGQAVAHANERAEALANLETELASRKAEVEEVRALLTETVEARGTDDDQRFIKLEEAVAEAAHRASQAAAAANEAEVAKFEALAQLQTATRERAALESSLNALRESLSVAESAANTAEAAKLEALAELQKGALDRSALEGVIATINASLDEQRRRAEFAAVRVEVLTSDRDRLVRDADRVTTKLQKAEADLASLAHKIEAAELENQDLKSVLQDARTRSATLEKTLVEANAEKVQLTAEIERRSAAETDAKRFRQEALQAEIQLQDALSRFAELQREIATRNSTLADYDREAADNRAEVKALELSLKQWRAEIQSADQKLVDAEFKVRLVSSDLQEAVATVEARDAQIIRFESESRDLKADLQALAEQLDREVAANAALRTALSSAQTDPVLSGQRLFQENVLRQEMARALKLRNAEFDELSRELEIARRSAAPIQPSKRERTRLQKQASFASPEASRLSQPKPSARRRLARALRQWSKRHPGTKRLFNRLSKPFRRNAP